MLNLPEEILTGCGPEEIFRTDYKAAAFPRSRPSDAPITDPTPGIFRQEEIEDPKDCYYFESDHLALKGNQDYLKMLETVITLQAQRTQAINDLETLLQAKKNAMEMDAHLYVTKLKNGELPEYPGPQKIIDIPEIDWSKYHIFKPDQILRPQTRTSSEPLIKRTKVEERMNNTAAVKSKAQDDSKPETFGQKWSCEEQQKLEELLRIYPSEENEMNRFRKIAEALGNRTAKQVFSRCQKYFKKLQKVGLEIPGRIPKARTDCRKIKRHKNSQRQSTFFPLDHLLSTGIEHQEMEHVNVKNEFIEDDLEVRQNELLQKFKEEKYESDQGGINYHVGYKCYICNDEPIKGIRWHCEECQEEEINLCTSCVIAQKEAEEPIHPPNHKFKDLRAPEYPEHCDVDYLLPKFGNTNNYLDPNFEFFR